MFSFASQLFEDKNIRVDIAEGRRDNRNQRGGGRGNRGWSDERGIELVALTLNNRIPCLNDTESKLKAFSFHRLNFYSKWTFVLKRVETLLD